jgi:hypothetical protein
MNTHRGLLHHQSIVVSNVKVSSQFYRPMFEYFDYELTASDLEGDYPYQDYKRWDLNTPHEFSICQSRNEQSSVEYVRWAVGHHHHIAFCADDREDVDRFYSTVLVPLNEKGLCNIMDPPCDCPEYNEYYYATFFFDPDGLKYEFVIAENFLRMKEARS